MYNTPDQLIYKNATFETIILKYKKGVTNNECFRYLNGQSSIIKFKTSKEYFVLYFLDFLGDCKYNYFLKLKNTDLNHNN